MSARSSLSVSALWYQMLGRVGFLSYAVPITRLCGCCDWSLFAVGICVMVICMYGICGLGIRYVYLMYIDISHISGIMRWPKTNGKKGV